jgi:hypothetical protein
VTPAASNADSSCRTSGFEAGSGVAHAAVDAQAHGHHPWLGFWWAKLRAGVARLSRPMHRL